MKRIARGIERDVALSGRGNVIILCQHAWYKDCSSETESLGFESYSV